jgi:hypothetical protein
LKIRAWLAALLLAAPAAFAHPAPNSIIKLEFQSGRVQAEYWVPVSELDYARAADPAGREFTAYLLRHVAAESGSGAPWHVAVQSVREADYLGHPYLVAQLTLDPPAGTPVDSFVLVDDVVTHEVRNHVLYVVTRRGAENALVGALQYPARRLVVTR